jgi:hypothetical protein
MYVSSAQQGVSSSLIYHPTRGETMPMNNMISLSRVPHLNFNQTRGLQVLKVEVVM